MLGASAALGDHLARHPLDWHALVMYEPRDLHPGVEEFEHGLDDGTDPVALRVAYRRCLLSIAARDVCGTTDLAQTAAELADLATATLRAALAIASAAAPDDAALCRLAVIAMGKCGGHELNYISDVDVIFVGEAVDGADEGKALRAATKLAAHMMGSGSAPRPPSRARSGPSTPTCAPRAATARWSAPSPATSRTTNAGRRHGSSRPC